ncbi:MAG: hypothetical protein WC807_00380 [Hyphomicrobium sp.]
MSRLLSFEAWLVVALAWSGTMAYLGYQNVPYVPLDMGGADPATEAALRAAMTRHFLTYGFLAAVPPLVLLGAIGLFRRGR